MNMARSVEIDPQSGFCGGVIRAITTAEEYLAGHRGSHLYSLGSIVHNEEELARLKSKGLQTIDVADLAMMAEGGAGCGAADAAGQTVAGADSCAAGETVVGTASCTADAAGKTVAGAAAADSGAACEGKTLPREGDVLLIRAHGEPPQTYATASGLGFEVIDCTCPVVLQLQKDIREAYAALDGRGRIIIFGKVGHAEVLGLVGQVGGDAVVVENQDMLKDAFERGEVPVDEPVEIFSQTTKSPDEYEKICAMVRSRMASEQLVTVHNTICRQVGSRHSGLTAFAKSHDIIIFVAGKSSSNGMVLCNLCRSVNIRTYHIGSVADLKSEWFREDDHVGVCGATSTPKWLLEEIAAHIENFA